jgi:hypothetical protein
MVFLAIFGVMGLVIGLVAVYHTLAFARSERRFERTGVEVVGRVVDEEQRTSRFQGRVSVSYYPVVQYQTVDGRHLRASTEVNAQRRPPIGGQVGIRHLKDEPTRIRLTADSSRLRRLTALVLAVSVLVTLIGLVCLTVVLVSLTS